MPSMRTFIAIDLTPEIKNELTRWQEAFRGLSSGAQWARPGGTHLTLKFLGEITEEHAARVVRALQQSKASPRFTLEVKGLGFFPDARRPRVFWVGVLAPPELGQLAARVEAALEDLGFARETRPFSPHLTLARFREPRPQPALREAAEMQSELVLGRLDVTEFFLYESKLRLQGAEYRKVASFPLC